MGCSDGFTIKKKKLLLLALLGLCCCMQALSSCSEEGLLFSCGVWISHAVASLVMELGLVGISSCVSWALERGLSSCGTWAPLSCGRWKPPKPGIKPMSPELAGGLPITGPPGKSHNFEYT